jgi:hypothetical protein
MWGKIGDDGMTEPLQKVVVIFEPRPDGGLRVYSDDVPGFVLSHPDPDAVMNDVEPALEGILSEILHRAVRVRLLQRLGRERLGHRQPTEPEQREYVIAA